MPWGPLLVLAVCGVFLNQLAFLKGLALTSPVAGGPLTLTHSLTSLMTV